MNVGNNDANLRRLPQKVGGNGILFLYCKILFCSLIVGLTGCAAKAPSVSIDSLRKASEQVSANVTILDIAISPDGKRLAIADNLGFITLINAERTEGARQFGHRGREFVGVTFRNNCVTGLNRRGDLYEGFLCSRNSRSLPEITHTKTEITYVNDAAFCNDGKQMVAAGADARKRFMWGSWRRPFSADATDQGRLPKWRTAVAANADCSLVLTGARDQITIVSSDSRKQSNIITLGKFLPGFGHSLNTLAIVPDGETFAWGSTSGGVFIHKNVSDSPTQIGDFDNSVTAISFSKNGKHLAASSYDGRLMVWFLDSARTLVRQYDSPITAIEFFPNSDVLTAGDRFGKLHLIDLAQEQEQMGTQLNEDKRNDTGKCRRNM